MSARRLAPWVVFRVHESFWVCERRDHDEGTWFPSWREAFDHARARAEKDWPWWM